MTEQEEMQERRKVIKQGFDKLVRENAKADTIWSYLNVNDVVIKVERELPQIQPFIRSAVTAYNTQEECHKSGQASMMMKLVEAGYCAVEPLIERK